MIKNITINFIITTIFNAEILQKKNLYESTAN